MLSEHLFRGLVVASLLSSSVALAHVSLPNGPAQADKSGTKITFGVGHGCDVGGVHYDTSKVRVMIPAGMTSIRPFFSDYGKPTITQSGSPAVITATKALQVGELVEGTMTGGMGDIAVITLSAPIAKMGWNIHGHANGGTQIIFEEHDKSAVTYTFAPATQAEWYLLVRNEGQANMEVMVKVELFGGMAWAWL